MRLHYKLMVTYAAVVVMGLAFVHVYLDRTIQEHVLSNLRDRMVREALLAADYLENRMVPGLDAADTDAESVSLDDLASVLASRLDVRVTLIDRDGKVLADSEVGAVGARSMENHAGRPEVIEARASGVGSRRRFSDTLQQEMMYVASVVGSVGDGKMIVRLAAPFEGLQRLRASSREILWTATLLAVGVSILLTYSASRHVSRPIVEMSRAAEQIALGERETDVVVPDVAAREIRELAGALNRTRQVIDSRIRQITESSSRIEAVLGSITEGILVTDHNGRILMANAAVGHLFGSVLPAAGRMPIEAVRFEDFEAAVHQTLENQTETILELTVPGAHEQHIDVHVTPILDGDACIGSVAIFYDISELRHLERVRRDFVANVSHELRTPLTAIRGCAATLAEGALQDREAAERFVGAILAHSERLQALLEDLRDLSGLESGRIEVNSSRVYLRQLVETAAAQVGVEATNKRIQLGIEVSDSLEVRCDPNLVVQALVNLLGNAVKYTDEGGAVSVKAGVAGGVAPPGGIPSFEIRGAREEGEEICVEVSDSGVGIPSESLPRVFERFYRVDKGRSRAAGGTGLGLSIVKHILESHGSRIYVRSELGKGSTFGFSLPVSEL